MRLTPVEQLQIGDRLGRDVRVGPSATPLLRAGVRMSNHYVAGLVRSGVSAVWIDDDISQGISPIEPITEQTRREATRSLQKAFTTVTRPDSGVAAVPQETVRSLTDLAARIAGDIADCGEAAVAIADLSTHDSYTLQHSIDVTAVGLLIAQRLWALDGWVDFRGQRRWDRIEERLVKLGVGLLLHDVGKLALPKEILHKPGPLTTEEFEVVRQHPDIGYEMLAGTQFLSPLVTDVVRHHHERWNGTGYPRGKSGQGISQFSRIAAVADVFDAISSARAYKKAAPVHVAHETIVAGSEADFDPEVVDIFRRAIAPYPPGLAVELSDGTRGIVAECPPWAADRPVIRIVASAAGLPLGPVELRLTDHPELEILAVDAPLPRTTEIAATG